jgi:ribosomal protein S18 acetylase RimI-like enzyme
LGAIFSSVTFSDSEEDGTSLSRSARLPTTHSSSQSSQQFQGSFYIRDSNFADEDGLYEIETACFNTPYPRKFFRSFSSNKYQYLKASTTDNGMLTGYIAYRIRREEFTMEIVSLAVSPKYRRFGIAKGLMNYAIRKAEESRVVDSILLHVSIFNFPAQRLYRSLGFVPSSWIKNYYESENEDALYFIFEF